jgi:hypothetical protein
MNFHFGRQNIDPTFFNQTDPTERQHAFFPAVEKCWKEDTGNPIMHKVRMTYTAKNNTRWDVQWSVQGDDLTVTSLTRLP